MDEETLQGAREGVEILRSIPGGHGYAIDCIEQLIAYVESLQDKVRA